MMKLKEVLSLQL